MRNVLFWVVTIVVAKKLFTDINQCHSKPVDMLKVRSLCHCNVLVLKVFGVFSKLLLVNEDAAIAIL